MSTNQNEAFELCEAKHKVCSCRKGGQVRCQAIIRAVNEGEQASSIPKVRKGIDLGVGQAVDVLARHYGVDYRSMARAVDMAAKFCKHPDALAQLVSGSPYARGGPVTKAEMAAAMYGGRPEYVVRDEATHMKMFPAKFGPKMAPPDTIKWHKSWWGEERKSPQFMGKDVPKNYWEVAHVLGKQPDVMKYLVFFPNKPDQETLINWQATEERMKRGGLLKTAAQVRGFNPEDLPF